VSSALSLIGGVHIGSKSAARNMVWLYRSPIPVGEGGDILFVQMISTCLRGAYTKRGGEVSTLWSVSIIFFVRMLNPPNYNVLYA
jgi:hypothetical protein